MYIASEVYLTGPLVLNSRMFPVKTTILAIAIIYYSVFKKSLYLAYYGFSSIFFKEEYGKV